MTEAEYMAALARRADTALAHLRAGEIESAEQELAACVVVALLHVARWTQRGPTLRRGAGASESGPPYVAIVLELERREPRLAVSAGCDIDRLAAWLVDHPDLVTLFSLAWALSRRAA